MEAQKLVLGAVDYVIFSIMLLISTSIGLFFRFTGGQQMTNEDYLLAGRNLAIFPAAVSLMATFLTTATIMGTPAEIYLYGSNICFIGIGITLGPVIAMYVFTPVYFESGVSTAYEYLEMRFGKTTRRILSVCFLIKSLFLAPIILYGPALALNAVTNLSKWMSVISIGTVCTFYSTLSGMKAVVWTDVFQSTLMFGCVLTVIIKGSIDMDGIGNIFHIAKEGGRLVKPSFSLDMETRYTPLSAMLHGLMTSLSVFGCSQLQIQRLLTLKNIKRSRLATLWSIPLSTGFYILCSICGLVFYAYFRFCDPVTSPTKPIQSEDQLLPYFITSALSKYPGLPGLCICGIFSASLSTLSSTINSMAAVTSRDLIQPFWPDLQHSVKTSKFISLFYGLLSIALTVFADMLGGLFKSTAIVIGIMNPPLIGIFLLATLSRTTNEEGAIIGAVTSVILSAVLSFIPRTYQKLPLSNRCPATSQILYYNNSTHNFTSSIQNNDYWNNFLNSTLNIANTTSDFPNTKNHFPLSFMWIIIFAVLMCIVVGYISSNIIGYFRENRKEVPLKYLSPVRRWFSESSNKTDSGKQKEMCQFVKT